MPTFELTLAGYRGDDDQTDELIKWISADSIHDVSVWIAHHQLWPHVQQLRDMGAETQHYTFDDGVDVLLATGKGEFKNAIEIVPSIWQITPKTFSVQDWIEIATKIVPA